MVETLPVRDALLSFAAREPLRAALFLTYSFDGRWFEDAIVPDLCDRPIATMLVIRDRNAISSEAPSVRYHKANARSAVFHPKLALLVADGRARAVISSANLTRGGFERQRELGRVFDLSPTTNADYSLFVTLAEYLQTGVATEVRGSAARDLADSANALREVLQQTESPATGTSHALLHNYSEPIWTQVLNSVPHRVLRRAVIISPFFEPDRQHPEDPAVGPQGESIFDTLFEDFEFAPPKNESPVSVYFRQCEGRTELPVQKLSHLGNKVAFFAQDEREQRLHAKLVLLEGAEGNGREPFLMALHGSPNFTTAGLLHRPPNGNSELAVLSMLPSRRKCLDQTIRLLGLEQGFKQVSGSDLSALQSEVGGEPPEPVSQGTADVTYLVEKRLMKITLMQAAPIGARVRVLLQRDGSWVVIGEADASGMVDIVVPVTGMADVDSKTKLLEIRGTSVRIEVVGSDGGVLSSDSAPINVDVPEEFCGLTLVGSALLTLDERIARAGIGVPPTYREQQKWLEARKTQDPPAAGPIVVSHQADLDRFYRNIHQGLRGILTRAKANPGSEFSVRRTLDELTRWAVEAATNDVNVMTRECRLFLIERLLRGARTIVEAAASLLKLRLSVIESDLCLASRLAQVAEWLDRIEEPALSTYAAGTQAHVKQMLIALEKGATH